MAAENWAVIAPGFGGDPKANTEALKAAGVNTYFYVSPDTAHEWQSWRRSLHQFAPLLFQDHPGPDGCRAGRGCDTRGDASSCGSCSCTATDCQRGDPDQSRVSPSRSKMPTAMSGWPTRGSRAAKPSNGPTSKSPTPRAPSFTGPNTTAWIPFRGLYRTGSTW